MIAPLVSTERQPNLSFDRRPNHAFLMLPGQFRVVDADTIWCLSDQRGPKGKEMSFSLRFRSIAAPERVKGRPTDKILQAAGIDPYSDHPGRMATEALRAFCDRRAVMVIPSGEQDRYGRSLVDMAVIPMKDGKFNPEDAVSLERLMIHKRVVDPFRDEELPKLYPQPNQSPDFSM